MNFQSLDLAKVAAHSEESRFEGLLALLGKPYARTDRYAIYCGDAVGLLEKLPVGAIDLTITSPPYNIGKEYEKVRQLEEYLAWCEKWIAKIHRATHQTGAFWLNLGYLSSEKAKAIPIPYLLWQRIPFYLIQEIVWNYGAGVAARLSFSPRNEKFLWYVKDPENYTFNLDAVRDPNVKYPNQKKNGKLKCNPLGKNPSDVWQIPKVTSGTNRASKERMPHPAQFPVAVVERIIQSCSNPGNVLLDPFMGSGSLLDAGVRFGRFAIGFEINKTYAEAAQNRMQQRTTQGQLFGR
jgi:adenine-specific DNA-methyltransferase